MYVYICMSVIAFLCFIFFVVFAFLCLALQRWPLRLSVCLPLCLSVYLSLVLNSRVTQFLSVNLPKVTSLPIYLRDHCSVSLFDCHLWQYSQLLSRNGLLNYSPMSYSALNRVHIFLHTSLGSPFIQCSVISVRFR